jgi:glycosyltransferase involved in cell wall biosynthesis
MAAGLPVVATVHAGIPEIVADGETGFLVAPGDSAQMAERSIKLLTDDELRCRYGLAAMRRVAETFTLENELSELRRVLADRWSGFKVA